jgi:hypothetical protein
MTRTTKLSLITLLAAATVIPGAASADPGDRFDRRGDRDRGGRWARLADIGTHVHDADDFVTVRNGQRFDQIELVVRGNAVRLDDVKIQFEDGREYTADVDQTIRPGQRVVLDVPSRSPIKMLVLEYGNRGPHYRAREDARVVVRGLTSSYRDWYYDRDERRSDRVDRRRFNPRARDVDSRFEWRGGVYVRIRG